MSLHTLFKLIIRISGVTCAITLINTKEFTYFNGLFLMVIVLWIWAELDWYRDRKNEMH